MINAIENKFLTGKRQRCVRHKMENVLGYIPKLQHDQVYPKLRAIFYQANCEKAEKPPPHFSPSTGTSIQPPPTACNATWTAA